MQFWPRHLFLSTHPLSETAVRRDERILFLLVLGVFLLLPLFAYLRLAGERDAFNKFKRPDQPSATLWDAFCSELRVTTN